MDTWNCLNYMPYFFSSDCKTYKRAYTYVLSAARGKCKANTKQTSWKIFLHYTNAEDFPRTRTFHGFSRAQLAFSWHFH